MLPPVKGGDGRMYSKKVLKMNSSKRVSPKTEMPTADSFVLESFLPYKASIFASIVSEQFARQYSEQFGITVHEWRVIAHLAHDDTLSVKDISDRADMDKAAVTRAVFRLESKKLVVKKPGKNDRRLVELRLTQAGRRVYENITPLANAFGTFLEEACKSKGLDDVHAVLDTLIDAARAYRASN